MPARLRSHPPPGQLPACEPFGARGGRGTLGLQGTGCPPGLCGLAGGQQTGDPPSRWSWAPKWGHSDRGVNPSRGPHGAQPSRRGAEASGGAGTHPAHVRHSKGTPVPLRPWAVCPTRAVRRSPAGSAPSFPRVRLDTSRQPRHRGLPSCGRHAHSPHACTSHLGKPIRRAPPRAGWHCQVL